MSFQVRLIQELRQQVAAAVAKAAMETGVARIKVDPEEVREKTQ